MQKNADLTCGFLAACLLTHSVVVNFHSVDLNVVLAYDFHPGELGSYLSPDLDSEKNTVYSGFVESAYDVKYLCSYMPGQGKKWNHIYLKSKKLDTVSKSNRLDCV